MLWAAIAVSLLSVVACVLITRSTRRVVDRLQWDLLRDKDQQIERLMQERDVLRAESDRLRALQRGET